MSRESSAKTRAVRNSSFTIKGRVLVAGFEPFGGGTVNPSERVAQALDARVISGWHVRGVVLPCRFGAAPVALLRAIRRERPRIVICLGLASRRRAVTPERWARNLVEARIPDNAGFQPGRRLIEAGGEAILPSGLPVEQIARAMRSAGLPARVSVSAGRFVCNELFYRLMKACRSGAGVRAGFIHLPPLRTRGRRTGGLSQAQLVRAVRIAITVATG
jgi:pyroglutamyl-peptidase